MSEGYKNFLKYRGTFVRVSSTYEGIVCGYNVKFPQHLVVALTKGWSPNPESRIGKHDMVVLTHKNNERGYYNVDCSACIKNLVFQRKKK